MHLKPLSHQGGASAASYKNAERRGKRGSNTTNAVATVGDGNSFERRGNSIRLIERTGAAFLFCVLIRVPWERRKDAAATQ